MVVAMTAGEVSGSLSVSSSYDESSVSSVVPVNMATSGGGSVTVMGADFGTSR